MAQLWSQLLSSTPAQSRHSWWLKLSEMMKAEGILSPLEHREQDRGMMIPQQMACPRKPMLTQWVVLCTPPRGKQQRDKGFRTDHFSSASELFKNLTVPRRPDTGRKNSPEFWVFSYSLLEAFYSILEGQDRKSKVCCGAAYLASLENTVAIVAWTAKLHKLSVLSWCSSRLCNPTLDECALLCFVLGFSEVFAV